MSVELVAEAIEDAGEHGGLLDAEVAAGAAGDRSDASLDELEIGRRRVLPGKLREHVRKLVAVELARGALAAGLDGQEAGDAGGDGDHVDGLAEHDESA